MFSFGIILVAAATLASAKVAPVRLLDEKFQPLESGCHAFTHAAKEFLPVVLAKTGIVPATQVRDGGFQFQFPERGAKYSLVCPGESNHFNITGDGSLTVTCDLNGELKVDDIQASFSDLVCAGTAETNAGSEIIFRNGYCYNGYTKIDIAFPTYTFIEICHNEAQSETLWTKHKIDGPKQGSPIKPVSAKFAASDFYPSIDVDTCYTKTKQKETVGLILQSASLAADYIIPSQQLYLARGHLVPKADFSSYDERLATMYFVNAIPQWQISNNGNWKKLEEALRNYAKEKNTVLTVYTGTWGVTTLKDQNNFPQEIWLGRGVNDNLVKRIPAPRVLYKVVLNPSAGTGVAIVQTNNPYVVNHYPEDNLCKVSICGQIPWVTWNVADYRLGYTYCCRVADFYASHPIIPNPGNPSLMV